MNNCEHRFIVGVFDHETKETSTICDKCGKTMSPEETGGVQFVAEIVEIEGAKNETA